MDAKSSKKSAAHRAQCELHRATEAFPAKFNTAYYKRTINPALLTVVGGKRVGRDQVETEKELISTLLRTLSRVREEPGFGAYVVAIKHALVYLGVGSG